MNSIFFNYKLWTLKIPWRDPNDKKTIQLKLHNNIVNFINSMTKSSINAYQLQLIYINSNFQLLPYHVLAIASITNQIECYDLKKKRNPCVLSSPD